MAARERYPRTRKQVKNMKESRIKGEKPNGEANGASNWNKSTCCLDQKSTDLLEYAAELDVEELKWPDEESRDSSQDQIKITRNNKPRSKQLKSWQFPNCDGCTSPVAVIDAASKSSHSGHPHTCSEKQQTGAKATAVVHIDQSGPFNHLSDEIILGIFKFLHRKNITICARVCKHWQRLAYDESLWRNVNLTGATIQAGLIGKILSRGVWVLRLANAKVESPCFEDSQVEFQDVVPLSPNSPSEMLLSVSYMDATLCHFGGDSLLCLLMHSRRLKYLSLESCDVSSSVLRAISECRFLEVLNLAMCSGVTSSGVSALVSGCKRLTHLNLAWTNLGTAAIKQIVQNLPQLRQLNLSGCRDTLTDDEVKHLTTEDDLSPMQVVEKLVKKCPQITHLDLSDCNHLTARTLELLAQLKYLQHLSLSRCYSISPLSFGLCAGMSALVNLSVFGLLNEEGLKALKKELSRIAVNSCIFTKIARPVDTRYYRGTIWGVKCSV